MKPKFNTSRLRSQQTIGASLITAITICFSSSAMALDNTWTGATDTEWNTATNWDQGRVPAFPNGLPSPSDYDDVIINMLSPIPTITTTATANPRDIHVGRGAGNSGRLDHKTGYIEARGWTVVGEDGGNGVYNLANTSVTAANSTGFAQGGGDLKVSGQLRVGRGSSANGTLNINTTGTLAISSEFRIGIDGAGATGTVNLESGTVTSNNWMVVGSAGNTLATLNINGGSISKNGNDHMIIADNGGTGVINMNAGTFNVNGECWIGQAGGNGTMNMTGGTLNCNSWVALGRANNAAHGTVTQSGGTWNKNGGGNFIIGDNGQGIYNMSNNAVLNVNGEFWVSSGGGSHGDLNMTGGSITSSGIGIIGRNGGVGKATISGNSNLTVNNQLFIGQGGSGDGLMTMTGGTLTVNNWTVIGREGGNGVVNMSGGTWNKVGANQVIIGSSGPGVMNMTGGLVDVKNGFTWVGENAGATTATLNLSMDAEWRSSTMSVGQNTPNAILNLNGGTLRTQRFIGSREQDDTGINSGTGTINFNGTQIIATANNTLNFISNTVDNANIGIGGLRVNSNTFNLTAPKTLAGVGGVVKSGLGTLTLNGASSYAGTNTVEAGKLALNSSATGTGNITVANDAALGINQTDATKSLSPVNVTLGESAAVSLLPTSLDINLGNTAGNPAVPALNVTGTLTLNRQIVINIADQLPSVGEFPLIQYAGAIAGGGGFVLGSLPNGVVASLVESAGVVKLNISSASLPTWDGTNESGVTKVSEITEFSEFVTVADVTGIAVTQPVRGNGIPAGTTVVAIDVPNKTITLSQQATASATGVNVLFVNTPGTNEGVWDINTTQNWVNLITGDSSVYLNPNPVLFNDTATGPTAVVLDTAVAPSSVTFNNSTKPYSLAGSGKITGSTGLTKAGTSTLSVSTANDYTGVTRLEGGTTTVATLTNGGVAGPLGAAAATPDKLVLAGGTLDYTGGAATIDRGFSTGAVDNTVVSGLTLASDVTISGQVAGNLGKIIKSGPGVLTLTSSSNVLGTGNGADTFRLAGGGLMLATPGQTNTVNGWAAFGSTSGNTSFSLLNGASLTVNGRTGIATGADSNTTVVIGGTSSLLSTDALQIAIGANSVGSVLVKDSGSINKTGGWLSIGNDATGTMTIQNNGQVTSNGDFNIGDVGSANGTLTLEDSGKVTSTGNVFVGKNGTTGNLVMSGTSTFTGNDTNIAGNAGSHGTINVKGNSVYTSNSRLQVGPGAGSVGSLVIEGSGEFKVNSYVSVGFNGGGSMTVKGSGKFTNTDDLSVNESGDVPATVSVEDNAIMSIARTIYVGRNAGRVGSITASGAAEINQTDAAYSFIVGPVGTGTLNVQGTAKVTSAGASGLVVTNNATGIGTVNLDGGTLTVRKVSDAGGESTFNFNGGVLKAGAGADLNFFSGLNTVNVGVGGAFVDSNGQTIAIAQSLGDGGGDFTKQGAGTLQLNGENGYLGTTTVAAGAIGGTGSVVGPLIVPLNSSVAPGAAAGTFTVGDSATIGGTYVCEIDGANADKLAVAGQLDITGAKLDINVLSAPAASVYVIASYSSLVGTFTVQDLPAGYTVDYNYLNGSQIALVQTSTPYSVWAASYGLNPLTDGAPGFDKDGDGQSNGIEYALGGSPISGSDNAKIYHLEADSSDVGSNKELLMTIAVRSGTPAFTPLAGGLPTATHEGATYTIQGSSDLTAFAGTVSVVTTVVPPAPNATPPTGYEYRTFSLDGSDGMPSKGFLRVKISN